MLVTSEMDSKGLPASGFESVGQLGPFPPLMIPPRADAVGGGAEDGTRRCCCWCCCPGRCPCLLPSPFPQLTGACCNRKYVHPLFATPFQLVVDPTIVVFHDSTSTEILVRLKSTEDSSGFTQIQVSKTHYFKN